MLAIKTLWRTFVWIFFINAFWSCDPWFSYSPYESRLEESYTDITQKNLELIKSLSVGDSKPFKVALLSDSHYHFRKLDEAIIDINQRDYFDFVIVTGDIADNGLKQEFIYFHESMKNLTIPYLTVIGNHDYLANGEHVYGKMFGPYNYTFVYNNIKFVLFDNVRWESEKVPDFGWLARELNNNDGYDHVIPFSHIPPFDGQMEGFRTGFHQLMVQNKIRYSIHGHSHDYSLAELYGNGVLYHTVSSPQFNAYTELSIWPDSIGIQKIAY
jgi:3',5'-cyclic-AMP phosphodiesterase